MQVVEHNGVIETRRREYPISLEVSRFRFLRLDGRTSVRSGTRELGSWGKTNFKAEKIQFRPNRSNSARIRSLSPYDKFHNWSWCDFRASNFADA